MTPEEITVNAVFYGKMLIDGGHGLRSIVDRYDGADGRERVR